MHSIDFEEVIDRILNQDTRYHRDAYFFVRQALEYSQKIVGKKGETRHVTGRELLTGIRDYALTQFGPMASTVFDEWGIRSTEDFGEIVFKMVEHNLLARQETDTPDEFKDAYDFFEVFKKPFLPAAKAAD